MKLRHGQLIRWFPIALAVTGGLVFFAGIFVAAFSMIMPVAAQQRINLPLHGAVYVGENTCYTCHSDEANDWSLTLYAQTIVNPAVKPKVVLTDMSLEEEIRQMNVGNMADASTTENSATPRGSQYPQHYIIKTEDGHTVLSSQWNTAKPESPVRCSGCHSIGFVQERLSIKVIDLDAVSDTGMNRYRLDNDASRWSNKEYARYFKAWGGYFQVIGSSGIHQLTLIKDMA